MESAKLNLTSDLHADMKLRIHSLENGSGAVYYSRQVSRAEFERVNSELFDRVLEPIRAVLDYTELEKADVDEVVMVGGSTRIPRIRELVSAYFNHKKLNTGVDADLAVVSGVSIQAGVIGGMWPLTVSAVEVQNSVKKIFLN